MRWASAGLALVSVSAAWGAGSASADRAYDDCLYRAAIRLDDQRPDPGGIAVAMDDLCRDEQDIRARAIAETRRDVYLNLMDWRFHRADALRAIERERRTTAVGSYLEPRPR